MAKLSLYHPNSTHTGSVATFELIPASNDLEGYISVTIANQNPSRTDATGNLEYPTYDAPIKIKLSFVEVAKMLQVFRGECESINDGRGLINMTYRGVKDVITFSHRIEPTVGYVLAVFRTDNGTEKRYSISFSTAEALGLCEVLTSSMQRLAFGF